MPSAVSNAPSKRRLQWKSLLDEETLLADFDAHGINRKHAAKLWRHFIHNNVASWDEVPEIPKAAIALLNAEYKPLTSKVVKRSDAADGSTTKLMIELQDGLCVEAVIMRYGQVELDMFPENEKTRHQHQQQLGRHYKSNKRATVCVSSQVGCAMGCTFCATGTMGLMANLTAAEILEQLFHANQVEKITGLVFMGMGEPLDNYDAVLSAINGMVDTGRFSLSPKRVSVSTVGVVPRIVSLKKDAPEIGLALSLHAPNQELRCQIVPTAKAWPINKIMDACDAFIENQNSKIASQNRKRHVLIEYVLISGVNDTEEVAHELGKLLQGREVLLNLIPYNPTLVPFDYKAPTEEAKKLFVDIVREQYGVHTLLRQTMGQDIDGACGQLVIKNTVNGSTACSNEGKDVQDLEDLVAKDSTRAPRVSTRKSSNSVATKPSLPFSQFMLPAAILVLLAVLLMRLWTSGVRA